MKTRKPITIAELNTIMVDYYFRDPRAILAGLYGADGDPEQITYIFEECRKRNIDVGKIIENDIKEHEKRWGKSAR